MSADDRSEGRGTLADVLAHEARAERQEALEAPDDAEGRELGRVVGSNLARLRGEKGMSLDALASACEIEAELIESLEAGEAVPSLRAVWRLATALGVRFGELLQVEAPENDEVPFQVLRADSGRVIVSATGAFRSRVMFREGDARSPEVYELTLAPGCVEAARAHGEGVLEHISVISGELIVRAGDNEARLGPGDAVFFDASMPHGYENPGDEPTVAHLVMRLSP